MERPLARLHHLLHAVSAALVAAGCGADAAERVSSDRMLALDRERVVTLGSAFGDVVFEDLRGIGEDASGRIWVAEWDAVFHRFDPDGRHLGTWRRRGGGPGEFDYASALAVHPSEELLAVRQIRGIKVVDFAFRELARWRVPERLAAGALPGVAFLPGTTDLLVPVATRRERTEENQLVSERTLGLLLRFSVEGEVLDTLGTLGGAPKLRTARRFGAFTSQPGAGRAAWLALDSARVLVADGHAAYGAAVLDLRGDTLARISRAIATEGVPKAEVREIGARLRRLSGNDAGLHRLGRSDGPDIRRGYIWRALHDSRRNAVLLCRVRRSDAEETMVDHFGTDGSYRGTSVWPACPWYIDRAGRAYLIERDSLDVPRIAVYRYGAGGR